MESKQHEQELRQRTVGQLIRTAREKAGLRQSEVAKKLGYSSAQFVSNWERGVSMPPLDQLRRLITLLKISPKALIEKLHHYQKELMEFQLKQVAEVLRAPLRKGR